MRPAFMPVLTFITSSLGSLGGSKGHLHLLEASAASVWGHGEHRVPWSQGSNWPFDAHSVPGVGQLQILQHPSTTHCSAPGDLQPPHTAGHLQRFLSVKWQSNPTSLFLVLFLELHSLLLRRHYCVSVLHLSEITCQYKGNRSGWVVLWFSFFFCWWSFTVGGTLFFSLLS